MKKLFIIALSMGLAFGASAQHGRGGGGLRGGGYSYVPRVRIGLGFYSPFYYGYGYPYYSPFGSPYRGYRPVSKLDRKVADIRADYDDKIHSARLDDNLSRKQRRATVHQLKQDRDREIHDLRANYYKQ